MPPAGLERASRCAVCGADGLQGVLRCLVCSSAGLEKFRGAWFAGLLGACGRAEGHYVVEQDDRIRGVQGPCGGARRPQKRGARALADSMECT